MISGDSAGRQLGLGVLGLHEGRTLLVALTHTAPGPVERSRYIPPGADPPPGVRRATYARAVAGCDLQEEKIAEARRDAPDLFYTTSYDALLARDDVDIVAIYTPDHLHGEHVVRAFEAGKHVICTKPLVNTLADARRVLESARRTGRRLLVGQSTRFFESFRRQRAAFERGEIGALELADAHYVHRMDWFYQKSPWAASETDWAFLGMSHPLDLLRWYLGPIAEVHAVAARSSLARSFGARSFDIYSVNVRATSGAVGRALGHYGLHELPSARNAIELVLYGAEGTSMAQYHDMRYLHTAPDGTEITEDMLYSRRGHYFNNEVHGMHYGEFAAYADHFAHALLEGRPCSPELEEAVETVCVMEAVRRSALSGRPVELAPLLAEAGLEGGSPR
ncbi:MAG TPA: Gfo/Idh/MocA family oxidoreductase [Roseiflexaceae bacterium]|nr:Gfo/Idh/MocA family oxidoreductase [Roseiflexaceae bacterium]